MAATEDARALLRAARKERRITHPHASYTSSGNLLCNLCEVPVKSEAAWGGHLHSTGHTLRLSRAQDAARRTTEVGIGNARKRKAGSPPIEEEAEEGSKRVRFEDDASAAAASQEAALSMGDAKAPLPPSVAEESNPTDEAELALLNAELSALDQASRYSAATISAPALSAEELAAQAREEISAQRGKRDVEIADEREEAEGRLQEEFAEMEELEGRVRRLRERREGLRKVGVAGEGRGVVQAAGGEVEGGGAEGQHESEMAMRGETTSTSHAGGNSEAVQGDEDDDDDDDFDEWAFGAR
ncbi:hypothetical protein B0A48_10475 [Cryoendolithus antarcticus]|uniref:Coiled-coil domain-containing protein 16 n=1 Tax=Cryoendolithus antarcticus TaxID=1507870 RepID=A0A1V8SXM8_9PEZI|nr:hypothetical protein B0A48_10475 [Cryoendolithus antarcticus]